jgi:thioredoxin reductase
MKENTNRREFLRISGMAMTILAGSISNAKANKTSIMENKTQENKKKVEVVIIGGGAAGLSAALFLVRARRSVIIYDSNEKRIAAAPKIHEYIGFEGISPKEYHDRGESEIKMYGGEIRYKKVLKIKKLPNGELLVSTMNEEVVTKSVIIATGLIDVLPDIPGLKDGWGKDIHVCPCFTGYELINKKLLVFGLQERIGQLSKFLTAWSSKVTVVSKDEFDLNTLKKLNATGVNIIYGEVGEILRKDNVLEGVVTTLGDKIICDAVFAATPMRAASDLAASLCEVDEMGFAITDAMGKTNLDGLWVIGNANDPIAHLAHAVAAGTKVGPMVTDYLIERDIQ